MKFIAIMALIATTQSIKIRQADATTTEPSTTTDPSTTDPSTTVPAENEDQPEGPSARDLIDHCDQNGDLMLSLEEGLDCIKAAAREDKKRWRQMKRWVKKNAGSYDADGN